MRFRATLAFLHLLSLSAPKGVLREPLVRSRTRYDDVAALFDAGLSALSLMAQLAGRRLEDPGIEILFARSSSMFSLATPRSWNASRKEFTDVSEKAHELQLGDESHRAFPLSLSSFKRS
jgi:hypothetical protein